jgi:uncharacterized glyoxalase superfamily protein PhnB
VDGLTAVTSRGENFFEFFFVGVSISRGLVRRTCTQPEISRHFSCCIHPNPVAVTEKENIMSATKVQAIPAGMHTVTPHLVCKDASAAIDWYVKAFGAVETARLHGPDGKIMHAQVTIGDSPVMLFDEMPQCNAHSPLTLNGTPVSLHIYVEDVDAAFERAVKAGAEVIMPLADMFWGDRYGVVRDPSGHQWSLATHMRDLTPEQIRQGMMEACGIPQ